MGWSMATHMRTSLVIDALQAAAGARGGDVTGVIFHADRGSVQLPGLRRRLPQGRRPAVHGRRRVQRGQRRGGELERDHETGDTPGP
ncbi:hypothetical protein AB0442_35905 [Kitasatospora sp. NPDC085895]|uniref:hypothetical protein n=1 Tax=Kitasatospora sp. NPDC085895 TaxID=3155057 RepID=UPI00344E01B7